ncbi:hypothetical protein CG430_08940 [Pantoea ananatis]|jgi:hypothetical protein|nr:hypothetical protein CG430_08940 [Pantoea ananatis]
MKINIKIRAILKGIIGIAEMNCNAEFTFLLFTAQTKIRSFCSATFALVQHKTRLFILSPSLFRGARRSYPLLYLLFYRLFLPLISLAHSYSFTITLQMQIGYRGSE